MRLTALLLLSIAVSGGGIAVAQNERAAPNGNSPAQEKPDEVVVTGKRLTELRFAAQSAREHAYDVFNEINSNNEFDVHCHDETRSFSHAKVRACRPNFENNIHREAAQEFLDGLWMSCHDPEGVGVTQKCMFGKEGQ